MKLMPIQLPPGLERNGTPYDSTGHWWDMNLFRWVSGSARPLNGWVRKTETTVADAVRRFFAWRKNDDTLGTLLGTETKLYVDFGGDWLDITPSGIVPPINTLSGGYGTGPYGAYSYGTPRPPGVSTAFVSNYALWSFANWGEDVLLLSSEDNRIFHYISATPDVAPVVVPNSATPGKPPMPLANAIEVTDERHVMIVGPTIGGVYYPHRIAWSSRETLDDWDFANVSNSAGFLDLTCSSPLNFLVKVREGLLAFTSTEVFLVQYSGSPYFYGATRIAEMPMFHPYTIAAFGAGNAMWFSPRAFQLYSGGAVSPTACPFFNDIKADFNPDWGPKRAHAASNGLYPEIWLFWPSASATECDRYAIFNYLEQWWGWGYLSRSAMVAAGALKLPLAGTSTGIVYEHENGWTDAGLPILDQRWLETGGLGIGGSQVVDIKQAMLATQDNFHDGGPVPYAKLQFFGRYTPDGQERVFGPYTPRRDGYTDTRVNAREARVRIIGNVDALFDVGTLRLDVSAGGQR